jgi:hypothetical protein
MSSFSARQSCRRNSRSRKNKYPSSFDWYQRSRRSAFAKNCYRLDKSSFERYLPLAVRNGWAPFYEHPSNPDWYCCTLGFSFLVIPKAVMDSGLDINSSLFTLPRGYTILRILSICFKMSPASPEERIWFEVNSSLWIVIFRVRSQISPSSFNTDEQLSSTPKIWSLQEESINPDCHCRISEEGPAKLPHHETSDCL